MLKEIIALGAIVLACVQPAAGQGLANSGFEFATVVSTNPQFGFLDWNLAVPGWSHSSGNDTSIVYYGQRHAAYTQVYMLIDSISRGVGGAGPLVGTYSMSLTSGFSSLTEGASWVNAYLSQTTAFSSDTRSVSFSATGPFQLYVGGAAIPVQSLGGNVYAGDISAFAGRTAEFKMVNASIPYSLEPVVFDNVQFSTVAVPEPGAVTFLFGGVAALCFWQFKSGTNRATARSRFSDSSKFKT